MKTAYFNGSGKFRTTENRIGAIEKRFSCKKAQSLSEMAIFGGVLLLVLSYFVSLGIKLTYQQDVQMRAFRMALSASANEINRPDAESTRTLVEDKLSPDPRNMVGKGELITVLGQGNIVWGNQMQDPIDGPEDLPRVAYVINGVERTYLTASAQTIFNFLMDQLYVQIPGESGPRIIQWNDPGNQLRCYKPTDDSPKQARILISEAEMKTEIITEVAEVVMVDGVPQPGPWWWIIAIPEDLNNGDEITQLEVLLFENGQINPNYLNADYVKEQADKVAPFGEPDPGSENYLQGFLPYTKVGKNSGESLLLQEFAPGALGYESTTQFDVGTTVTHYIRKNDMSVESFPYSPPAAAERGIWVWQSAK